MMHMKMKMKNNKYQNKLIFLPIIRTYDYIIRYIKIYLQSHHYLPM